ncbi:MAG TPA: DUF2777 family protein [Bacilli bacterium]|nr:DUF2777 family protein [Bacilli bacterium]
MDRIDAQKLINKHVVIDEKANGGYYGKLIDIIAEPRKPWKGIVKIISVTSFPEQNHCSSLQLPIYSAGEKAIVLGSKISPATGTYIEDYNRSILFAIKDIVKKLSEQQLSARKQLIQLVQFALQSASDKAVIEELNSYLTFETEEERYFFYEVLNEEGQYLLVNRGNQQLLPLEGCPFLFELEIDNEWVKGYYLEDGAFKTNDGKTKKLTIDDRIRMEKKQLNPYELLLKELEQPALDSLERSLQQFQIGHEHLLSCHNTLLSQLVNETKQQKFSGTNFILYERDNEVVSVQHHYERLLKEVENDLTYDRFELTSGSGKRYIITYTNEASKRANKNN